MKKETIFIVFIIIILTGTAAYAIHRKSYTKIDYCRELAGILASSRQEEFAFENIHETEDGDIVVKYKTRRGYEDHSDLDCAADVAMIRDLITGHLKDDPANELNSKKIYIYLGETCCPAESMAHFTNYDTDSGSFLSAVDFNYYGSLNVKKLSSLEKLGSAKSITLSADTIDTVDFLSGWTELEYMQIYSNDWKEKEDMKQEITELLEIEEIIESNDHVFEFTVK